MLINYIVILSALKLEKDNIPQASSFIAKGQTQLLCANGSKPDANGKCPDGSKPQVPTPQTFEKLNRQIIDQKYSQSRQLISGAEMKKVNAGNDIIENLK